MIRVSEGKYRVGDNLTLIFVRVSIQLVNVLCAQRGVAIAGVCPSV